MSAADHLGPQFDTPGSDWEKIPAHVPISTYGVEVREQDVQPTRSIDHPDVRDVPVDRLWTDHPHLMFPPKVDALAATPAHDLPPVNVVEHPDGTYLIQDHHRVAAARMRGDHDVRVIVRKRADKGSQQR